MHQHKILLVEDHAGLAAPLIKHLEIKGYFVKWVITAELALETIKDQCWDLILLDVNLPGMDGFHFLQELRKYFTIPTIILSANQDPQKIVQGLEFGADDYVTKPFNIAVLLARIKKKIADPLIKIGHKIYNPKKSVLIEEGEEIILTQKENKILSLLVTHPGQIFSREKILNYAWDHSYSGTDRTVDNLVVSLRKKIGSDYIKTARGQGHYFCKDALM